MRFSMDSYSTADSEGDLECMRFSTSAKDLYNLENFLLVRHLMMDGMNFSTGKITSIKGTKVFANRSTMLANSNGKYWDRNGIPFL